MSVTALMRFGEFKGSIKEKGYTKGFFTMDDKKQEMKNKKQKYAYWMRPSLVDEMTEMLDVYAGAKTAAARILNRT